MNKFINSFSWDTFYSRSRRCRITCSGCENILLGSTPHPYWYAASNLARCQLTILALPEVTLLYTTLSFTDTFPLISEAIYTISSFSSSFLSFSNMFFFICSYFFRAQNLAASFHYTPAISFIYVIYLHDINGHFFLMLFKYYCQMSARSFWFIWSFPLTNVLFLLHFINLTHNFSFWKLILIIIQ